MADPADRELFDREARQLRSRLGVGFAVPSRAWQKSRPDTYDGSGDALSQRGVDLGVETRMVGVDASGLATGDATRWRPAPSIAMHGYHNEAYTLPAQKFNVVTKDPLGGAPMVQSLDCFARNIKSIFPADLQSPSLQVENVQVVVRTVFVPVSADSVDYRTELRACNSEDAASERDATLAVILCGESSSVQMLNTTKTSDCQPIALTVNGSSCGIRVNASCYQTTRADGDRRVLTGPSGWKDEAIWLLRFPLAPKGTMRQLFNDFSFGSSGDDSDSDAEFPQTPPVRPAKLRAHPTSGRLSEGSRAGPKPKIVERSPASAGLDLPPQTAMAVCINVVPVVLQQGVTETPLHGAQRMMHAQHEMCSVHANSPGGDSVCSPELKSFKRARM